MTDCRVSAIWFTHCAVVDATVDSRSACLLRAGKHQGFTVNAGFLRIIAASPEDRRGLFQATTNRLGTPIQIECPVLGAPEQSFAQVPITGL
ncbi:MAG: hypothetical protein ABS92_03895 [Thiobacillus sp. SCN 63-374]|nr:MAG: hypothetical protein ABS92_03895 [Thiobacillus sp. SCN 63-374]